MLNQRDEETWKRGIQTQQVRSKVKLHSSPKYHEAIAQDELKER